MPTKTELANTIRLEMRRRKLTIEKLAEISHLSRSTITRVLNPHQIKNVKYDSLFCIIDFLKINPRLFSLNSTPASDNGYPLVTLSQFVIYFPLILSNIHLLGM